MVAVEVGDAVGVALPELLPVNVGEGLLDIVPVTEGVLEGLTVTESERGKPGTMHLHCCLFGMHCTNPVRIGITLLVLVHTGRGGAPRACGCATEGGCA